MEDRYVVTEAQGKKHVIRLVYDTERGEIKEVHAIIDPGKDEDSLKTH